MFERSFDNGWAGWVPLPPLASPRKLVGKPAAVSWSSGRNDVFAHDDFGTLWHLWANDGNWAPEWEPIASGAPCLNDAASDHCRGLSVASWGVNHLDVFDLVPGDWGATTISQQIYDNGWGTPFHPFGEAPPATQAIAAVSWSAGRVDLVATSASFGGEFHPVQYFTNDDRIWGGPYDLGAIGGSFVQPSNIGITTWGVNVLDILSFGSTTIGQKTFRPDTLWTDWAIPGLPDGPGPTSQGSMTSVSSGPGRIDVVYAAPSPNNNSITVSHAWFNESAPYGWFGPETL